MKNNDKLASFQAKQEIKVEREATNRKDNKLALILSGGALALALLGQFLYFSVGPGFVAPVDEVVAESEPAPTNSELVPDPALAENRTWTGALNQHDQPIGLELYGDLAPQATASATATPETIRAKRLSLRRVASRSTLMPCLAWKLASLSLFFITPLSISRK